MSTVALDHVVVICDEGAPQADALVALGLREGSSNRHEGQGTANRRFFFRNAYLELLWVDDYADARKEPAARTRLWERWLRRHEGACPLGIALRPNDVEDAWAKPPFSTWPYHAPYLPQRVAIGIALATPLTEPEFLYLNFATSPESKGREPMDHALGVRALTSVGIGLPGGLPQAPAAKASEALGIVSFYSASDYVMELCFDSEARHESADLRPGLPLIVKW